MRTLERNKVTFWFALYEGTQEIVDDEGYLTGQYEVLYGKPQKARANISSATGSTETLVFGDDVAYDRVIVCDLSFPPFYSINEQTILWVDRVPLLDEDGTLAVDEDNAVSTPHDYIVRRVAKSLNSLSIAISRVKVS